MSKSSTENILNISEILLILSGFVLTFGAIGEYLEDHGKLPRWMRWPKLVFVFMVALSLVGEFISDAGVFFTSNILQTISDAEYAGLNKEAGDARQAAGTADERSSLLEASNKQLGIDLEAEKQKTAVIEKDSATLRAKAAELESVNIDLRRAMRPRRAMFLTALQIPKQEEMIQRISSFAGTALIIQTNGDQESDELANDLLSVFGGNKWRTGVATADNTGIGRFVLGPGVIVWTWGPLHAPPSVVDETPRAKIWKAGEFVLQWLKGAGLLISGHSVATDQTLASNIPYGKRLPEDTVVVLIGPHNIEWDFGMIHAQRQAKQKTPAKSAQSGKTKVIPK